MRLKCALLMVAVCMTGSARGEEDAMAAAREFLLTPAKPVECQENDERVQVMVLGSYHMANPGADVFNMESDDVLAPARQEQVAAVVEGLADFGPTKIALESDYREAALGEAYTEYLADRGPLTRGEEQQIGFRLARHLGHDTVYGVAAPADDLWGDNAETPSNTSTNLSPDREPLPGRREDNHPAPQDRDVAEPSGDSFWDD